MTSVENSNKKLKVLTVGDGDLTLSLALARAYGDFISLTASVLDKRDEVLQTYPDAPLEELEKRMVPILFGIDATQLHQRSQSQSHKSDKWDLILFHHPHLGLASLEKDESEHAARHFRLLVHYLYAAQQVSNLIHVCLCGKQSETWRLLDAAERTGMELVKRLPTSVPFAKIWSSDDDQVPIAADANSQFAAPRRYRNGKLGSRHFLGKYGYRHRRTEGDRYSGTLSDMSVSGSEHFVFCKRKTNAAIPSMVALQPTTCGICGMTFSSEQDLEKHLLEPARPEEHSTNYLPASTRVAQEHTASTTVPAQGDGARAAKPTKEATSECATDSNSGIVGRFAPDQPPQSTEGRNTTARELVVAEGCTGKRLRWFIQHHIDAFSKRQAGNSVQSGMVRIDGEIVQDTSRILQSGNVVLVTMSHAPQQEEQQTPLEILHREEGYLAAWKPAGVRTKGAFKGTLESRLSEQEGSRCFSLSSFETSCPGVCVLSTNEPHSEDQAQTRLGHVMTTLVHGRVPDHWSTPQELSMAIKAKWNKRSHDGESVEVKETVEIRCTERIQVGGEPDGEEMTLLSTLSIKASTPSTSSICQLLRHLGFPVVGDTYCRQEYMKLKRSIRNRIKDRLCIGCYSVEWNGKVLATKTPPPDKLSANYWEKFLKNDNSGKSST